MFKSMKLMAAAFAAVVSAGSAGAVPMTYDFVFSFGTGGADPDPFSGAVRIVADFEVGTSVAPTTDGLHVLSLSTSIDLPVGWAYWAGADELAISGGPVYNAIEGSPVDADFLIVVDDWLEGGDPYLKFVAYSTVEGDFVNRLATASDTLSLRVTPVPLPAGLSLLLAGLGALGLAGLRRA